MTPIIGYVSWNRMGITIQNLELLLKTKDPFELYIVDNNSQDDTWKYLCSLKDERIKEITRLDKNYGLIFALNYVISKRRKNQPFINIDADVSIYTSNWITNCEKIIKEFPEVGIVGNVRPTYYSERNVQYEDVVRNGVKFRKTKFLLGCCLYWPPNTLETLGYFSEELCLGDLEITARLKYLKKWVGFCPDNHVLYNQPNCTTCNHQGLCSNPNNLSCFDYYKKNYKHRDFYYKRNKDLAEYSRNLTPEKVYCGSIHDPESQKKGYDKQKALENFSFYG